MKKIMDMVLKAYLKYHDKMHNLIVSKCGFVIFDGLHPKNVFNFRSEFFIENVDRNDIVIDIACGTGLILKRISPFIKKGWGIELSKNNITICKSKHLAENIGYIENDLYNINYTELQKKIGYSTAIFSHILEHIADVPALLLKIKAEKLLICVPSQENWHTQLLIYFGLSPYKDRTHYREYTREVLMKELSMASYQVEFIGFNPEGEIICKAKKS